MREKEVDHAAVAANLRGHHPETALLTARLEHIESEAEITVASVTFEIVGFPPLKSDFR